MQCALNRLTVDACATFVGVNVSLVPLSPRALRSRSRVRKIFGEKIKRLWIDCHFAPTRVFFTFLDST